MSRGGFIKPTNNLVVIDCGKGPVQAMIDSGASISILRPDMVGEEQMEGGAPTYVTLQGPFGDSVKGVLANVCVKLMGEAITSRTPRVPLTCAITEKLSQNIALITPSDYEVLQSASLQFIPEVKRIAGTSLMYEDPRVTQGQDAVRLETITVSAVDKVAIGNGEKIQGCGDVLHEPGADLQRMFDLESYRVAQLSDPSLQSCWKSVKTEGSVFFVNPVNKLLYRKQVIGGFEIDQLVLPLKKREKVLQTAHDSEWSMHFGIFRTL